MPALPITVSGLKPGALGLKAFTFAPRSMKLNWRTLSQVNLDKIKREVNIDTLQDHLEMVAFANAAGADCAQYADPNFIKVFQLAQLMIEYCLYSQEVIGEARLNLQKEYETQKAKADKLAASEKALKDQVAMLKKELKLQRKTSGVRGLAHEGDGDRGQTQAGVQGRAHARFAAKYLPRPPTSLRTWLVVTRCSRGRQCKAG
jgi:hypothetical protein